MGITLARAFVAFLLLSASAAQAHEIVGRPRIVDGDTIAIAGTSIRLHGIDAPEKKQAGGKQASAGLAHLIADSEVRCRHTDTDRRGRAVAICNVAGRNLNASMVRAGLAWAYVRYSRDYVALELEARRSRVGIWGTEQVLGFRTVAGPRPPWEYRTEQRRGLLRSVRAAVRDWIQWLIGDELGI